MSDRIEISVGVDQASLKQGKKQFDNFTDDIEKQLKEIEDAAGSTDITKGILDAIKKLKSEINEMKAEINKALKDLGGKYVEQSDFNKYTESITKQMQQMQSDITTSIVGINKSLSSIGFNGGDKELVGNINAITVALKELNQFVDITGKLVHSSFNNISFDDGVTASLKKIKESIKESDKEFENFRKKYSKYYDYRLEDKTDENDYNPFKDILSQAKSAQEEIQKYNKEIKGLRKQIDNNSNADLEERIVLEQRLFEAEFQRYNITRKLDEMSYFSTDNEKKDDMLNKYLPSEKQYDEMSDFAETYKSRFKELSNAISEYSKKAKQEIKESVAEVSTLTVKEGTIRIPVGLNGSISDIVQDLRPKIDAIVKSLTKHNSKDSYKIPLEFNIKDAKKSLSEYLSVLEKKHKLTIDTNLTDKKNGLYDKIDKAVGRIKAKLKNVPLEINKITVKPEALVDAGKQILKATLPAKDISDAVVKYSNAVDKLSRFGSNKGLNFADGLVDSTKDAITQIDILLSRAETLTRVLAEIKNLKPSTDNSKSTYVTKDDLKIILILADELNEIKTAIKEINNKKIDIKFNPSGLQEISTKISILENTLARAFKIDTNAQLNNRLKETIGLLDSAKTKAGELSKRGYKQYIPFFEEFDKYKSSGGKKGFADMSWSDSEGNKIKFTAEQLSILNEKYKEYSERVKATKKELTATTPQDSFSKKQIESLENLNKIAKDIFTDLQDKKIKIDFDVEEINKFRDAILDLREVLIKAFNIKTESELNKSLTKSIGLLDEARTKSGELSKRGYKQYSPFFEEYDKYKSLGGNKSFEDITWNDKNGNIIKFTAEQLEVLNKQYAQYNKYKKNDTSSGIGVDNNITKEIEGMKTVQQALENVITVIKEKNDLFETEAKIVADVMDREVKSVTPLKTSLSSIRSSLDKISRFSDVHLDFTAGDTSSSEAKLSEVIGLIDTKNASLIEEKRIARETISAEVIDFRQLTKELGKVVNALTKIKSLSKERIKVDYNESGKNNTTNNANNSVDDTKKTLDKIKLLKKNLKEYLTIKKKYDSLGMPSLNDNERKIFTDLDTDIKNAKNGLNEFASTDEKVVNALRDFNIAYEKVSSTINASNQKSEVNSATKSLRELYSVLNKFLTLNVSNNLPLKENLKKQITDSVNELKNSGIDDLKINDELNTKMRNNFLSKKGKNLDKYYENKDAGKYIDSSKLKEIENLVNQIDSKLPFDFANPIDVEEIDRLVTELNKAERELNDLSNIKYNAKDFANFSARVSKFMQDNSKAVHKYQTDFGILQNTMRNLKSDADFRQVTRQFSVLEAKIRLAGDTGKTAFDALKYRIKSIGTTLISYVSVFDIVRYAREVATAVTEVNTALTELIKVSDMSNARLQQSFEKSKDTAKELGSTLTDAISATADWSRLGYNPDQAEELARVALLYKNVGDNIDIDTANSALISTLQGFQLQADQAESIIDKFNEVANNYAIDSGGIGQALQRSAASFNAANTSLSESIALVTATKLHWLCIW